MLTRTASPALDWLRQRHALSRFSGLAWVALATVAAFWWSLASLASAALTESPIGFTPVMALLALVAAAHSAAVHRDDPTLSRDQFLDRAAGAMLIGAAIWLAGSPGPDEGWYVWLARWDLLALVLWCYGWVAVLWGFPTLLRHHAPVLYALLIWPQPWMWLHAAAGPTLAELTALAARPLAEGFGTPLAAAEASSVIFVSAPPAQPYTIIISTVCSGSTALFAVLMVGLLTLQLTRGPLRNKAGWLAAAAVLALASNIARVTVLLGLAAQFGVPFALGVVHPILGAALLAPTFWLMWTLLPRFGLTPAPMGVALRDVRRWLVPASGSSGLDMAAAAALLAAAALVGRGNIELRAVATLATESAVAFHLDNAQRYLPELTGWVKEPPVDINWQNLFGPDSSARTLVYSSPATPWTVAQLVATRDRGSLSRYTLEQCGVFHGRDLISERRVDLGAGQTGWLLEMSSPNQKGDGRLKNSLLYWNAPVQVNGERWHVRVALLLDTEAELSQMAGAPGDPANHDPEREQVNRHLLHLARSIVAANARHAG